MDLAMKPRSIKQNKTLNSGESMSNPRFEDVDMLSFRPTRGKWWVIMSFHLPSDKDSEPFIGNTSPVLIWSLHIFALWFISCLCFVHCFISWSLTSSGFFQQYNGFPVLGQTTFWIWTCAIGDLAPSYMSIYQSHQLIMTSRLSWDYGHIVIFWSSLINYIAQLKASGGSSRLSRLPHEVCHVTTCLRIEAWRPREARSQTWKQI